MKLVTWNLGYWQFRRHHQDAWQYLRDETRPDIALLQETCPPQDVDQFFPFTLVQNLGSAYNATVNGVWNLVLACQRCNRGAEGKFARVPSLKYLERLHTRNSFLINSHHPLRETLINQTGLTEEQRRSFLQEQYRQA